MDYYKQTNETKQKRERTKYVCMCTFSIKMKREKRVIRIRRVKIWHKSLKETTWERGDKTIKSWIYCSTMSLYWAKLD